MKIVNVQRAGRVLKCEYIYSAFLLWLFFAVILCGVVRSWKTDLWD